MRQRQNADFRINPGGERGRARTCNRQLRRLMLYPIELLAPSGLSLFYGEWAWMAGYRLRCLILIRSWVLLELLQLAEAESQELGNGVCAWQLGPHPKAQLFQD